MSTLLPLAIAPTLICLFYIYIRDKYEKEPVRLLIIGVLFGVIISFPIISVENFVTAFAPKGGKMLDAFYTSYVVAAGVEEIFKYVLLYFLVWRNPNFNERFDGIVYSVFISLGFAGFENVLYVFNPELGGIDTALIRAFLSVPGHAFFGVFMGYFFAIAKFEEHKNSNYLFKAIFFPWLVHGTYDFILLSDKPYLMIVFVPFMIYLWISGFRKIKVHIDKSPFKQ